MVQSQFEKMGSIITLEHLIANFVLQKTHLYFKLLDTTPLDISIANEFKD